MTSQYVLLKTNSYIIRMNPEDNLRWFHGRVSREKAEEILREEGTSGVFLVRESSTAYGDYVLSVLHEGVVWHYQIRRHGEDAFFSIDDQTKIHGLDSLIEHYRESSNGLVTRLVAIVRRELPPTEARKHGKTLLLHRATKEGNLVVVSELFKYGFKNIDAKSQDGQAAVHLASKLGKEKILKMLIDYGANVNCRDTKGNTPLHYACRNKDPGMVKLLIGAKANIQARNNETGWVPLHDAASEGNLEIVKELLKSSAPHMPRTSDGQFPADFAKSNGHAEIVEYLCNYVPPPATTSINHWYHGTLDRNEAVIKLREYVQKVLVKNNEDEDIETLSSGVFLVRYSNRNGNGSHVLTLLFEDQPKHFMIQKNSNYLFIDEGPYMTSIEHLIQHYSIFADGLPINLKHPVLPPQKPPIPLCSTIPKTKRLNHSVSAPQVDHLPLSPSTDSSIFDSSLSVSPNDNFDNKIKSGKQHRNLSVPNEAMINQQGVWETSPPPKVTNFLASDTADDFYNTPSNNCAIDERSMASTTTSLDTSHSSDNNDNPSSPTNSYFIESDKFFNQHPDMADKDDENVYFIDAPTIPNPNIVQNSSFSGGGSSSGNNNEMPVNASGYVVSKNVPMYFDNPSFSERLPSERLQSVISMASSERSDSEFYTINTQISNQESTMKDNDPKPNYFIPKECLILSNLLGTGEFGSVFKGVFERTTENGNVEQLPVAIKTLHDEHCKENRVEFLREAHVMMQLRHHCIVRMIGISKGPPLRMVQELLPIGSMLDYLQNNFEKISNSNFELKLWASQIACGMNFLESQHFVHRDLAARNILLASQHQAKISDFGLSRALGAGNDYYQASQGGKWPIKWYAPESFNYGTFSHASDVWSYGVTLWEMFSLGQPPYGDMKGVDVIKIIEEGKRLVQPVLCPDKIFSVMDSCWIHDPKKRPTFKQLTDFFSNDPEYQNISELVQTIDIS